MNNEYPFRGHAVEYITTRAVTIGFGQLMMEQSYPGPSFTLFWNSLCKTACHRARFSHSRSRYV